MQKEMIDKPNPDIAMKTIDSIKEVLTMLQNKNETLELAIKNLSNGINYINNKQMNFIYKIVKDKIPYDKIIKEYKRCFKGGNKK